MPHQMELWILRKTNSPAPYDLACESGDVGTVVGRHKPWPWEEMVQERRGRLVLEECW